MFFELRQYRIKAGKMEQWVNLMEEKIIPALISKGNVVVGSFISLEEDDLYVWIRRFENEAELDNLHKTLYNSDYWKDEIKPQVEQLLDLEKMQVTRLEATSKSVIR